MAKLVSVDPVLWLGLAAGSSRSTQLRDSPGIAPVFPESFSRLVGGPAEGTLLLLAKGQCFLLAEGQCSYGPKASESDGQRPVLLLAYRQRLATKDANGAAWTAH